MSEYSKFSWSNALRIILNHRFLTFLMVILIALSLSMFSVVSSQTDTVEKAAENYAYSYDGKDYYFTGECLSDVDFYNFTDDSNSDYQKLLNFLQLLDNETSFTFMSLFDQAIEICDIKIPDEFLYSYDYGKPEDSVYMYNGKTRYFTKALQVSDAFFGEMNVSVAEGRGFAEEDYIYDKNKNIPVLLGSAYKGILEIGDVFSGRHFSNDEDTFEVIGFVAENSFFLDNSTRDFTSCEHYVILPSMHSITCVPSGDEKGTLLQQLNGVIAVKNGYEEANERFHELLDEAGIGRLEVFINNPDYNYSINDRIKEYSSMTKEVEEQFHIILIMLIIFTVISLSVSICGFIREQHYTYGVCLLCGASYIHIAKDILRLIGIIVFLGALLAFTTQLIFADTSTSLLGLLYIWLLAAGVWALTSAVTIAYLRKMDVGDIIGGRE